MNRVTDRFYNGDSTNDNPPQSAGLFDSTKTNWHLYWGGRYPRRPSSGVGYVNVNWQYCRRKTLR